MQTFICPQCGAKSSYDPWLESAQCKVCGYAPPPPGSKPVSELLASQAALVKKRDDGQEVLDLYRQGKAFAPDFIILVERGEDFYTFGEDAERLAGVCGGEFLVNDPGNTPLQGVEGPIVKLPAEQREGCEARLAKEGLKVGVAGEGLLICPKCGGRNHPSDVFAPAVRCVHCGYIPPALVNYVRGLIEAGIAAAKQSNYDLGRAYLQNALMCEPSGEQRVVIWSWMAEMSANLYEKRDYLRKVLSQDPEGAIGRGVRRKLAQVEMIINAGTGGLASASGSGGDTLEMEQFDCPQCGGTMRFVPKGKKLVCDYCQFLQPASERLPKGEKVSEQSFEAAMATLKGHGKAVSANLFACPACGASFILGDAMLSFNCPHCAATCAVEEVVTQELIPPTGLIPFAISAGQARKALAEWLKQTVNPLPSKVDPLAGMYFPVWTFDLGGTIGWRGQLQVNWLFSDQRSGDMEVSYDDVLVPASRSLPMELAKQIGGYDLAQLEAYQAAYLVDWPAELYEVNMSDATLVARSKVVEQVRGRLVVEVGQLKDLHLRTSGLAVQSYKLVLLPVWMTKYHWMGDAYQVMINGQTGAVRGLLPPEQTPQG
ncbi:MAG: hypothetical protein AB1894_26005 [Chloroflexota bacterium]